MDPLSDVLSLVKIRGYLYNAFSAGGEWSIAFGPHEGIKFYALVMGAGWLCLEGIAEPLRLEAGDCLLLPHGRPFHICTNLALLPVDALTVFPASGTGGLTTYQGGGDFLSLGGFFTLAGEQADLLLGMLPLVVHIRAEADQAVLRWTLERLRQELREPQPGGFFVAQQLATLLLVQALRRHLAAGAAGGVGWLYALADKRLGAALTALHAEPARRWTVQALAACAGMSRTSFAVKFKATVGQAPLAYLTRWRMRLAADRLTHSSDALAVIAPTLGYDSESAFSTAFKRVMGCSPRHYNRGRPPTPPAPRQPAAAVSLPLPAALPDPASVSTSRVRVPA